MTHLAAGRHRSVMARPMLPSMLVDVTRLHAAIATSTGRIASSLLFTTASSHVKSHAPVGIPARPSEHAPCGSAPLPVWPILRGAGAPDCGNSLLPRQAQSDAMASTLATPKRNSPRFPKRKRRPPKGFLGCATRPWGLSSPKVGGIISYDFP